MSCVISELTLKIRKTKSIKAAEGCPGVGTRTAEAVIAYADEIKRGTQPPPFPPEADPARKPLTIMYAMLKTGKLYSERLAAP